MARTSRVLLVDPDPSTARVLRAALGSEHWTLSTQPDPASAGGALSNPPDLVIADADLPDDGARFLLATLDALGEERPPVLFLSSVAGAAGAAALKRAGADALLSRPFAPGALTSSVERLLALNSSPGESHHGELKVTSVSHLLRQLVLERSSCTLRVVPDAGRSSATVHFVRGRAVAARFGRLVGISALFQLILHERGRYQVGPETPDVPEDIQGATLPLLMEAYRLLESGAVRRVDAENNAAVARQTEIILSLLESVPTLVHPGDGEEFGSPPSPREPELQPEVASPAPNVEASVDPEDANLTASLDTVYTETRGIPPVEQGLAPLAEFVPTAEPPSPEEAVPESEPQSGEPVPLAPEEFNALDSVEYAAVVVGWDEPDPAPPASPPPPPEVLQPADVSESGFLLEQGGGDFADQDEGLVLELGGDDSMDGLVLELGGAFDDDLPGDPDPAPAPEPVPEAPVDQVVAVAVLADESDDSGLLLELGGDSSYEEDQATDDGPIVIASEAWRSAPDDDVHESPPVFTLAPPAPAPELEDDATVSMPVVPSPASVRRVSGLPPLRQRPTTPIVHAADESLDDFSLENKNDLAAETLVAERAVLDDEEPVEELELIWEPGDDDWDEAAPTAASAIDESQELGVVLVTDTWMDLPVGGGEGRRDLMEVYEVLKKIARKELAASSVQLGNLEGNVVASTIKKLKRRDAVAAFSAQAMEFAREDAAGRRFTVLDAGETHVFVVEIDQRRLLTMLFESRPDAITVMGALRPILQEIRGSGP